MLKTLGPNRELPRRSRFWRTRGGSDIGGLLQFGIALAALGGLGACSGADGADGASEADSVCMPDSGTTCGVAILASGRNQPAAIAVNGTGVYWAESGGIVGVALNGGSPVTLASGAYASQPVALALGATDVYWSNWSHGAGTTARDSVMKVSLALSDGGAPSIFSIPNSAPQPWGLAVVGGVVYWGDYDWNAVYAAREESGSASAIWLDRGQQADNQPTLVAADAANVYFATAGGEVNQTPTGGGAVAQLRGYVPGSSVTALAIDGASVYWIQTAEGVPGGALVKEPRGGGAATTLVPADPGLESVIAVDPTGVYWDDGSLMKTSLDGSATATLAAGESATAIALDASRVYWTNSSAGTVAALAK